MLHKLARLFARWNARFREHPTRFLDPRFGSVEDVAKAQADYLVALAAEDDITIHFDEHGAARQRALPAPAPPPPPTEAT